jgi:hypothetical protein
MASNIQSFFGFPAADPWPRTCGVPGPRGLTCVRPHRHRGDHRVEVEGPPLACDVCSARAGEDCADPKACRAAREQLMAVAT